MISQRPYQHKEDLSAIGLLIRRAYARKPYYNAWSFARFDIWAQRRIADEAVHGNRDWKQDLSLWVTERGELAGAALFEGKNNAALLVDPDEHPPLEQMLTWSEGRYAAKGAQDKPLIVETTEVNVSQGQLLQSRNYTSLAGHYICREKPLHGDGVEAVVLPPGFAVKSIETVEELKRFHEAVEAVFNFEDSVEVYRIVQQAPSYVPELDLVILSERGKVASFCTAWLDRESGVAEFEPVGTVPEYRGRGLAAAVLAEASNRLRALGCRTATVMSWSESVGANRLYAAAGLRGESQILHWQQGS